MTLQELKRLTKEQFDQLKIDDQWRKMTAEEQQEILSEITFDLDELTCKKEKPASKVS